mgnify:FL=1
MSDNQKKQRFLNHFISIVQKNSWNIESFNKAQKKLKYSPNLLKVLFPNKLNDLVFYFSDFINKKMITAYKKKRINKKSLRLQILTLLKIRFNILNEYKSVIKESMVFLCSPSKQLLSSKLIFKTADFMWISINDKSTDYNFYTKRAILGTIYSVVILFWLNDKSNKLDKTYNLLEKLIMNMNFISSLKKCLKEKFF